MEDKWEALAFEDFDLEGARERCESVFTEAENLFEKVLAGTCQFIVRFRPPTPIQSLPTEATLNQTSRPMYTYTGPPKTNDMLKPKKPLEEKMSLEAALHWFRTYKNHLDLNKVMLSQQSPGVQRGLLENDIDSHLANALRAHPDITDDTPIESDNGTNCLKILKDIFMDKNPTWVRRKTWFECTQKEDETVIQWWNRKLEIAKQCDLENMKPEELAMLQFMMGINRKEKKIREEFLKQRDPKLKDLLEIAKNWQRSGDIGKDLDNHVEVKKTVCDSCCNCQPEDFEDDLDEEDVVDVRKAVSNYRQDKISSWKEKSKGKSGGTQGDSKGKLGHGPPAENTNPNDNLSKPNDKKKNRPTCSRCAKNPNGGHATDKCPALELTCHGCNKKGHIKPACRAGSGTTKTGRVTVQDVVIAKRIYSSKVIDDSTPLPLMETLRKHAIADQEYVKVHDAIKDKKDCGVLPGHHPAQKFKSYWDALTIEPTLPGLVLYHGRIWVPAKARSNILNKLHKDHCGPERCIQKAKNYYFWPNMAKDIKSVISGCEKCITYSASKPRGPNIATVANRPFEKISMDYAEFKKHYYLVIVDRYSRIPMVARTRGMTTKHVLPVFQKWISYYGKPTHVRTDGGPCFRHRDFSKWCQDKDVIHEVSNPHNHESNGQAERAIREIKNLLKKTDGHWETFQEALTEYKNCPGYDGLAPTQWAFGRLQRTSVPGPSKSYDRVTDYELKEHLG